MPVRIDIPTWTTFNKIPVGTPDAGLAILNSVLGLSLVVGDDNPVWRDLQDLDLGGGPLTRGSEMESLSRVSDITNAAFLTVEQCGMIVAVGGEVQGFPAYVELLPAQLTDEVPATFDDATYEVPIDPNDPDGGSNTVTHTWATYEPNHPLAEFSGKHYKELATERTYLPASQWVGQGLTVLTVGEYQAIQNA